MRIGKNKSRDFKLRNYFYSITDANARNTLDLNTNISKRKTIKYRMIFILSRHLATPQFQHFEIEASIDTSQTVFFG